MAILSLTEYKTYTNITTTNADARLNVIIPSAEKFILDMIKKNIEVANYKEKYDGDGEYELLLNQYPITNVVELKIEDELINVTDYYIYNSSGIIKMKYGLFTIGLQNIYIDYNAGYSPVPSDIKMAIAELVTRKVEQFDKKGNSFSSESFMGGSLVFKESDLTDFQKSVINFYRKKGVKAT
jgi:hypothetical protein